VVPLLTEEESLPELYKAITAACTDLEGGYEIVFVDDGSTDGSWDVITKLAANDPAIRAVRFRRNFGKSAALSAGFHEARGRYIVTMDADLQDDPAEIPRLIEALEKGRDLVSGWKHPRHDPLSKTIPSKVINAFTARLTKVRIHDMNCGLKIYRREVVADLVLHAGQYRFKGRGTKLRA